MRLRIISFCLHSTHSSRARNVEDRLLSHGYLVQYLQGGQLNCNPRIRQVVSLSFGPPRPSSTYTIASTGLGVVRFLNHVLGPMSR